MLYEGSFVPTRSNVLQALEQLVIDEIPRRFNEWLDTGSYAEMVDEVFSDVIESRASEKRLEEIERKLANIRATIENGLDDMIWANEQLHKFIAERVELEDRLDDIGETQIPTVSAAVIRRALDNIVEVMGQGSNAQKTG